ncbi:MAG: GTP cyclohydrolase I FolE [Leptospiraceae bacterium]|nr:GTP cyclohydrolase I FolE [Leptospiraceae bacterium]
MKTGLTNDSSESELEQDLYLEMGEAHLSSAVETPLRPDAFDLDNNAKIRKIQEHFAIIMETLGLDLSDDSLRGTPYRVAKMYVDEIFSGLDPANRPRISVFENKYKYGEMLVEKNIRLSSNCEHHFVPIIGKAHVAYISSGKVIGLSKINRLVQYYASRPQVQERLTRQILEDLKQTLDTPDVAVIIDAEHMCVSTRGIRDTGSATVSAAYSGVFEQEGKRRELLNYIKLNTTQG